jgi:hypothetical protein
VVHKNCVSEDYLKLKKGPFFIKILAEFNEVVGDHIIGGPLPPTLLTYDHYITSDNVVTLSLLSHLPSFITLNITTQQPSLGPQGVSPRIIASLEHPG